ncbi:hypothetical protein Dip518_001194 [Parelusimicrobium proximum]|uniref:hypothetical protein n=1 Tax=Parelusimicrobium proximum TaxID=3228953 RepID=UPI003D179C59
MEENKKCGCKGEEGKCCKGSWMPHKWFRGRVLRAVYITLFYLSLIFTIVTCILYGVRYGREGAAVWIEIAQMFVTGTITAIFFATLAHIIKVLHKIKKGVLGGKDCCKDKK